MSGLTFKDLDNLSRYAAEGNRELYWNYLAHLPGNDGYGLLALGVVRNDNMPGAVANNYAQDHGGRQLSEREWEAFGQRLIKEDYEQRRLQFEENHDSWKALNLPAKDVEKAHDTTFDKANLDKNAWTPRLLLEAARKQGGEQAAERVWSHMLDNSAMGLSRGTSTTNDIHHYLPASESTRYLKNLGIAWAEASQSRDAVNPDIIGSENYYFQYSRTSREWVEVSETGMNNPPLMRVVADPELLRELNDTRQLRLERQHKTTQFHADDPYREIARSPHTVADNNTPDIPAGFTPLLKPGGDMRDPAHPGHTAYATALGEVQRMETRENISGGTHSEVLAARIAAEAGARKQNITRVEMGRDGQIEVIERHYAVDEGRRFALSATDAMRDGVETSSSRWLEARSPHYVSQTPAATRSEAQSQALTQLSPDDQRLFAAIREKIPSHIGDDAVAQSMLMAKWQGVRDASQLASVSMAGDRLLIAGTSPGSHVSMDATAQAQPLQQSVEQAHQVNQQNAQQQIMHNQQQQQAQGMALA